MGKPAVAAALLFFALMCRRAMRADVKPGRERAAPCFALRSHPGRINRKCQRQGDQVKHYHPFTKPKEGEASKPRPFSPVKSCAFCHHSL